MKLHNRKFATFENTATAEALERIKAYCQKCYAINVLSLLQERVYLQNQPVASDHELWRQCRRCGNLVLLSDLKRETKIKGFIEIDDDPLSQGSLTLASTGRRTGNKTDSTVQRYKKEVERLLKDYGDDSDLKQMTEQGKQIS